MPIIIEGGCHGQFLPPNISDCTAWFDAADANSITLDGTAVTQWNDKSGNDNHIAQGTAANQPTYQAAGWAGADPTVYFDGTSDYLEAIDIGDNILDNGDLTVIMALRMIDLGGTRYLFSARDGGTYNQFSLLFLGAGLATPKLLWEYGVLDETVNIGVAGTANESIYYMNRNTVALTADFIAINAGTTNTDLNRVYINQADARPTVTFQLGAIGSAIFCESVISEFIVYKRVLTEGERLLVTNYLRNKWGV